MNVLAKSQEPKHSETKSTETVALNCVDYRAHETHDCYLISKPSIGAVSILTMPEMLVFERLANNEHPEHAAQALSVMGIDLDTAIARTERLVQRLIKDGWTRTALPQNETAPLDTIYLTLTRVCNLTCPYCYQGLKNRNNKTMELGHVKQLLDDVSQFNENAHIIVTGGEPMMHPNFMEVMDEIAARGFTSSLLTNGVFLTEEAVQRLKTLPGLERVQVSIDGITPEIHALSRGRKTFEQTVDAIKLLSKYDIPFLLNPTMHEKNVHEIIPLAQWAMLLGGSISANDLRHVPDELDGHLTLTDETFGKIRKELSDFLMSAARQDTDVADRITRLGMRQCSTPAHNARFNCGVAHSLLDIDWNGDVYPCHMIKGDDVKLGNVFEETFADILANGRKQGWRTPSSEIEGCKSCSFVSTCASGCRAKTYHAVGTPMQSSPSCENNGKRITERMLLQLGLPIS